MNTKLLLGLAIMLGILALAFGGPLFDGRDEIPDGVQGELIGGGHFILEREGSVLLEETYTLFFHPVDGYMLLSQSVLAVGDQPVSLSQQTQYDRHFLPVFYQLAAETPSGTQIVSAQMGVTGLEMEVRAGLARQSATVSDTANVALLDNNLIGPFAVLLQAIRAGALDHEFTAAIPQALLSLPARAEGPDTIEFSSGEIPYEGTRFDVHVGDTRIVLIEYEGRLVGLLNRTQGTVGYDTDRFPDGIEIPGVEEPVQPPVGVVEEEITFSSGELTLAGTLSVPESGNGPSPAALFVHGSGPVDRDGNAPGLQMDAYRQLAHGLAEVGIASLRYDKRGVGASDGVASAASRLDLLTDVRGALEALRSQPEVDRSRVFLVGHSEGAYLASVIAAEDEELAGAVLVAGAARSLDEITRWQIETLLRQQGATEEQIEMAMAQEEEYIEFVETSTGEWDDYSLEELRGAMPWLSEELAAQLVAGPLSLSWLREHYLDDPAATLWKVTCPVLVINGEKDLQVPAAEAEAIQDIVTNAGNGDVTVLVVPDLNHLLRYHPEEPNLVYRHLDEPVDSRVIEALTEWAVERFVR